MLAFVVRRLLSVVAVMVGAAALVFSVFDAIRPERISDGTGYPHQLVHFLDRAFLHFDLGTSWDRLLSFEPVAPLLRHTFPADLSLVAGGLIAGTALGGKPNTYEPLTHDPLAWLQSLWLPWLILGLPLAAITMRMMRATLAETLEEDFVRTARGKGLSPARVMRRHAVPAASAAVISLVGVTMGTLVTNAILLEYTFSIPGIFSLMRRAMDQADFPVIEGVAIAGALLVVVANLLADLVHAWLDPRVRTI